MRRAPALALVLAAGCASPQRAAPETARERPPNVIVILADDLGWGELGCYGQTRIRTPRLDRLAREGLRATQFYAGAPVCAPSRCALLTGRHAGHGALRDNRELASEGQWPLADQALTLAEVLRARGYATACFGKWGLGGPGSEGAPERQGFDLFFGYLCQRAAHTYYPDHLWRNGERVELDGRTYSHDLIAEQALDWLRARDERPFFLYYAPTIPHVALEVPEDALAEYLAAFPEEPYDGRQGYRPHPTPHAAYAAMVTRLDRDVGRLVDRVDELGLGRDTLILFTSDNGPTYERVGGADSAFFASTAGLRGFKGSVYEGGLRVPFLARWTGRIAAGGTCDAVGALWDLFPTLVELTGAAPAQGLDGTSLVPELLGRPRAGERPPLYWELAGYGGQQAVRFGDWKAVRRGLREGRRTIELYDLARDPDEMRDLAGAEPALVERARGLFASLRTESEAFPLPQ